MKRVSFALYDMAGREMAVPVDCILSVSIHSRRFNANNLSNGVYIGSLISGEYSYNKKMT